MPPVSPLAAAKRMCAHSDWTLSNLEVQKILYIAHMFQLGEVGEPLISSHFEAWEYGPVEPNIYHRVKIFGGSPIKNIFHSVGDVPPGAQRDRLDSMVNALAKSAPGRLVAITHWEKGAWARNYRPGVRSILIPDEDITAEYNERRKALGEKAAN